MDIEVFLTGHLVEENDVLDRTVIVIDVLRTATTVANALSNGARAIVPAADMAEASKIASNLDASSYYLAGERVGVKIEGYTLGNSPIEFTRELVRGKTLILTTTNGTPAIRRCRHAKHLVTGSFVNVGKVVDFARQEGIDVTIVCSGWRNRVSLEDTICAGMILDGLWNGVEPSDSSDTSHIAFALFERERNDIQGAVTRSLHGKRLAAMGLEDDVAFCGAVDAVPILPYYKDSRLIGYPNA